MAFLFNGMSKGMSQIQQLALACVKFIFLYYVPFHGNAGFNDFFQILPEISPGNFFKQYSVTQYTIFQCFRDAVRKNNFWQCLQYICITEYQFRLIKSTCQIFSRFQIHCRFSAYGRINGRQKCGGNLYKGDAPQIYRRAKTCQISCHTAAQSHNQIRSGHFLFCQKFQQMAKGMNVLGCFASGKHKCADRKSGFRQ